VSGHYREDNKQKAKEEAEKKVSTGLLEINRSICVLSRKNDGKTAKC